MDAGDTGPLKEDDRGYFFAFKIFFIIIFYVIVIDITVVKILKYFFIIIFVCKS